MRWKSFGPGKFETVSENPTALFDQVTRLFVEELKGKRTGQDLFVPAIPEYGYSREFEVQGHRIWFSQETDDEVVHIVIADGSHDPAFAELIRQKLEALT